MYSMEKMKELAVRQMRAAVALYETCESLEAMFVEDNDTYNKLCLRSSRDFRYDLLRHRFDLTAATEERELWDEIAEFLD